MSQKVGNFCDSIQFYCPKKWVVFGTKCQKNYPLFLTNVTKTTQFPLQKQIMILYFEKSHYMVIAKKCHFNTKA